MDCDRFDCGFQTFLLLLRWLVVLSCTCFCSTIFVLATGKGDDEQFRTAQRKEYPHQLYIVLAAAVTYQLRRFHTIFFLLELSPLMLRSTGAWVCGLPFFGAVRAHIESTAWVVAWFPRVEYSRINRTRLQGETPNVVVFLFAVVADMFMFWYDRWIPCDPVQTQFEVQTYCRETVREYWLPTIRHDPHIVHWILHLTYTCPFSLHQHTYDAHAQTRLPSSRKSSRNPGDQLVIFFAGIWKRQRYYPLVN